MTRHPHPHSTQRTLPSSKPTVSALTPPPSNKPKRKSKNMKKKSVTLSGSKNLTRDSPNHPNGISLEIDK